MKSIENCYKVFFDRTREAMYVSTIEGEFLDVNFAFARLIGTSVNNLIGSSVDDVLYNPRERRRFKEEIALMGVVTGFSIQLKTKSGEPVDCLVNASIFKDTSGNIAGYIGELTPLSSLKSKPIDQAYSVALMGSNDGLWEWDIKNQEVHYSPRWKSMLGYGANELSNDIKEWFSRVHPEDLAMLKQNVNNFLLGEQPRFQSYHRVRHHSGEWIWVLVTGIGEFNSHGKCIKIGGSFTNVSAQLRLFEKWKQNETKLLEANANLSSEKEILSQFFSEDMLKQILSEKSQKVTTKTFAILQIHLSNVLQLIDQILPDQFVDFMNELLTDIMDLVYSHKGNVFKILGDTVICSFQAYNDHDHPIKKAYRCAKAIKAWLETYNAVRPTFALEPLQIFMGLSSGRLLYSPLGSVHRKELALVGKALRRADLLQRRAKRNLTWIETSSRKISKNL